MELSIFPLYLFSPNCHLIFKLEIIKHYFTASPRTFILFVSEMGNLITEELIINIVLLKPKEMFLLIV